MAAAFCFLQSHLKITLTNKITKHYLNHKFLVKKKKQALGF